MEVCACACVYVCECARVCLCVCVRARAHARVCVCVRPDPSSSHVGIVDVGSRNKSHWREKQRECVRGGSHSSALRHQSNHGVFARSASDTSPSKWWETSGASPGASDVSDICTFKVFFRGF